MKSMKNDDIEEWGVSPTWKPDEKIQTEIKEKQEKSGQAIKQTRSVQQSQTSQPGQATRQTRPVQPGQPGQPGQAARQTKPVQPGQPGQPSQATRQTRPVQPGQPGQVTKQTRPVQPGQAGQAARQTKPVQPGQPGQPSQATRQTRPVQPGQPGQVTKQTRPVQPGQPGQAARQTKPVQPGKAGQTVKRQAQPTKQVVKKDVTASSSTEPNGHIIAAMKKDLMVSTRTVQGNDYELYHIGVLDGIRAISILIIVWFHFWQQSWIMPVVGPINLDWLPRNGSILVDMMILLSGFCLFLPYARHAIYGEQMQTSGLFYTKRAARIMPSYFVAIAVALIIALIGGTYVTNIDMLRDLLPHLVFLHNWFVESSSDTQLIGVLWTVAVEVQFYIFFPMLAKSFIKKPMFTYWIMVAVGVISSILISANFGNINQGMFVNNTFTFTSVYANGMLGAWVYVYMTKRQKKNHAEQIFFTIMSFASIWLYKVLCEHRMSYSMETKWQLDYRYLLSLVFLLFVVSTIMAVKWYRLIWDNVAMRFISSISFNLYICHQFIAVKLKEWRIPYWTGEEPPNIKGDAVWQWEYLILCIVLSLIVAVAMTYLVEKPLANLIKKIYRANHSE